MTHTLAIIRWCALLASTSATPEEAARWRDMEENARRELRTALAVPPTVLKRARDFNAT